MHIDLNGDALLPARSILERYRVTDRTIDRWVKDSALGFPRPLYINKRRYFRLRELVEWERTRAAGVAA